MVKLVSESEKRRLKIFAYWQALIADGTKRSTAVIAAAKYGKITPRTVWNLIKKYETKTKEE